MANQMPMAMMTNPMPNDTAPFLSSIIRELRDAQAEIDDYTQRGGPVSFIAGRVVQDFLISPILEPAESAAKKDFSGAAVAVASNLSKPVKAIGKAVDAIKPLSRKADKLPDVTKGESNLPVKFDGEFATKQVLGTTKTPGGRDINFHAADRMVNPPKGRSQMSPADVDAVLDGATNIRKRSFHPQGNTLTIQNKKLPGKPQVVVDEATGNRVITVINPK